MEEAEGLVRPQPDQLLDRHRLQRADRLADAPHPPAVAEYIRKGKYESVWIRITALEGKRSLLTFLEFEYTPLQ